MRILDRYILKRIFWAYLLTLVSFVSLFIIIDLFTNIADILKYKPPLYIVVDYYLNYLPLIFLNTSPFSLLISTLYTIADLNRHNEILTMKASGISTLRISAIALILPLVISAFSFLIQEKVLIVSQKTLDDIKSEYFKKSQKTKSPGEKRNLAFREGDKIFFAARFIPKNSTLENVILLKENLQADIEKKIMAKRITYKWDKWIAYNLIVYTLDKKGDIKGTPVYLSQKDISLATKPQDLVYRKAILYEYQTILSLKSQMNKLKKARATKLLANLTINYHKKIAQPLSHFFLIMGILPFALKIRQRKAGLSAVGVGFLFGFAYYFLFSLNVAFGKIGILLPFLSVWITPISFLAMGLIGLYILK